MYRNTERRMSVLSRVLFWWYNTAGGQVNDEGEGGGGVAHLLLALIFR